MNSKEIFGALARGEITSEKAKELLSKKKLTLYKQPIAKGNELKQRSTDIAVIGMSGQFAMADNIEEFWQNISKGKNCISEVPKQRWDVESFYDKNLKAEGKTQSKWIGAIRNVDHFDSLFFNISPLEAEGIDPQQRLFLQNCWHCIEDAAINPSEIGGENCGVYVGCGQGDYASTMGDQQLDGQILMGSLSSILSARISYILNLTGPCMAIDTACSAALVALNEACNSLVLKNCNMALAGGVSIMVGPTLHILTSKSGMLSQDGKCHTFDQSANGYVPSDGVGVVLLKRLEDALRDGDPIHGLIKAWGINQDGRTNGITAPSMNSQVNLQKQVHQKFNIDSKSIGLVEAHGTGTKLGDPIEVEALKEVLDDLESNNIPIKNCALGSVKSNIGHSLTAAGISGVIKVLMALKHQQLPPTINFEELNEHIDLSSSRMFINTGLQPWNKSSEHPRRGCVNSFGMSGTNGYIVLEEYISKNNSIPNTAEKVLIVLSAKKEEQLKSYCKLLASYLAANENVDLRDLAYTLQVSRDPMEHRIAIYSDNVRDIIKGLTSYFEGNELLIDVMVGQLKKRISSFPEFDDDEDVQQLIQSWILKGKIPKLMKLWCNGLAIDWKIVGSLWKPGEYKPKRIHIVTYPFAKKKHWIHDNLAGGLIQERDNNKRKIKTEGDVMIGVIDVLLKAKEPVVSEHIVNNQKILPGMAMVEMARSAVVKLDSKSIFTLSKIKWLQPLVVEESETKIKIEVSNKEEGKRKFSIKTNDTIHCTGVVKYNENRIDSSINIISKISDLEKWPGQPKGVYELFASVGIEYGPGYRGVQEFYFDKDKKNVWVRVVKGVNRTSDFIMDPMLMDCSVHSAISFAIIDAKSKNKDSRGSLAFAIDSVKFNEANLLKLNNECWVHLERDPENNISNEIQKLNIDVFTTKGELALRLKNYCSKKLNPKKEARRGLFLPKWESVLPERFNQSMDLQNALIISSNNHWINHLNRLNQKIEITNSTELIVRDGITKILDRLKSNKNFKDILWILDESLDDISEVKTCFALIKALIVRGYASQTINWNLISFFGSPVNPSKAQNELNPIAAALHGLLGSMRKEQSNWRVRIVDLATQKEIAFAEWKAVFKKINELPYSELGDPIALRGVKTKTPQWYKQKLISIDEQGLFDQYKSVISEIQNQGTYIIIGGTGGIGALFTEYLISNYNAKVVWFGRTSLNKKIQNKISAIDTGKGSLKYLRCDCTDAAAFTKTVELVQQKYGNINGVVHSAIGSLDDSISGMSESLFSQTLAPHVDITLNIQKIFQESLLDFILFFSSSNSMAKNPGQSGYSSGCLYKDALAGNLRSNGFKKVKVINWGYWGEVGVAGVVPQSFKHRLKQNGVLAINPKEAMETIELLLKGPLDQLALIKTTDTPTGMNLSDRLKKAYQVSPGNISRVNSELILVKSPANVKSQIHRQDLSNGQQIDNMLYKILFAILKKDNIITEKFSAKEIEPSYSANYKRWITETLTLYVEQGFLIETGGGYYKINPEKSLELDLDKLFKSWNELKVKCEANPNRISQLRLVDVAIRNISDVISGRVTATNILFPNSSVELVEGIYKNNKVSDYFNQVMSAWIDNWAKSVHAADPGCKIKILEIGAGTGGASIGILNKLKVYSEQVEEYCYTDLSKAFLLHGEKAFTSFEFMNYKLLNVAKPLETQGFDLGSYDLVVASNVLHATNNISETLRNIKAALKENGTLLINEMSGKTLFAHLTFGLLEGWWMYEDDSVRMRGCPGIHQDSWKEILESLGYHQVFFPVSFNHHWGYQVIISQSDGWYKEQQSVVNIKNRFRKNKPKPNHSDKDGNSALATKIAEYISFLISETLKIDKNDIDIEQPLESYGIDSILVVQLTSKLEEVVPDISSTLFFEYQDIKSISGFLEQENANEFASYFKVKMESISPKIESESLSNVDILDTKLNSCKSYLIELISNALKLDPDELDVEEPLETYGIDSILVVQITNKLEIDFPDVSSTLFFECLNIKTAAESLLAEFPNKCEERFEEIETTVSESSISHLVKKSHVLEEDIAIIGMSGRFPGAKDVNEFWDNLKNGVDSVTEIPENRWSIAGFYTEKSDEAMIQNKSYGKWGGFVDGFSHFDSLFFNISPMEARSIDPQERLFLEESWKAIENSGYTKQKFKENHDNNVGVFVGITKTGFNLYQVYPNDAFPTTSFSSLPNRVSWQMNFNGPSMPIDTMCSSSLTAIHEACEHIHRGECEAALVGGVNLYVHPINFIQLSGQQMLSKDGKCKTFGKGANGLVPAEGVGVVVIKPFRLAVRDHDFIHGIIKGTSINHGGKTNGYTIPNPVAQGNLIAKTIEKSNVSSRWISYVEAHGTGTELGDPIEINGLTRAFKEGTKENNFCSIGSVKSNIGHSESAAGIAGLIKILLQIKNQQLAPTLHVKDLNLRIPFIKTPFVVQKKLQNWEPTILKNEGEKIIPRVAGLSSFGAGGSNAHIIVQENNIQTNKKRNEKNSYIGELAFILSARSLYSLNQRVVDLANHVEQNSGLSIQDISYTLCFGREPMELGLIIMASTHTGLLTQLKSVKISNKEDLYKDYLDEFSKYKESWEEKLLELESRTIPLPTYAFEKEIHWGFPDAQIAGWKLPNGENFEKSIRDEKLFKPIWFQKNQNSFESEFTSSDSVQIFSDKSIDESLMGSAIMGYFQSKNISCRFFTYGQNELWGDLKLSNIILYLVEGREESYSDQVVNSNSNYELPLKNFIQKINETNKDSIHIDFFLISNNHCLFFRKKVVLSGAGINGLIYSLAQSLYLFRVRNIDIDMQEVKNDGVRGIEDILNEPWSDRGKKVQIKSRKKFEQRFAYLLLPKKMPVSLKTNGVYLFVGGSGAVGTSISKYLMCEYNAKVIWVGRKDSEDVRLTDRLKNLGDLASSIKYYCCDIVDAVSTSSTMSKIINENPTINGVIYTALVLNVNDNIQSVTDEEFTRVTELKSIGLLNTINAIKNLNLDFFQVFSSGQAFSFSGAAKLTSYAAGISFGDSLVNRLNQENLKFPIGIINWGFWESSLDHQGNEMFSVNSFGALSDTEGCELFEQCVSMLVFHHCFQLLAMKTTSFIKELMEVDSNLIAEQLEWDENHSKGKRRIEAFQGAFDFNKYLEKNDYKKLNQLMANMLLVELIQLGVISGEHSIDVNNIVKSSAILNKYQGLVEEFVEILKSESLISVKGSGLTISKRIINEGVVDYSKKILLKWEKNKKKWKKNIELNSQICLVDSCLSSMCDILTGKIPATDIMFPDSSMELVEGIYKDSKISKIFNQCLMHSLIQIIKEKSIDNLPVKIIEIGAGTGGTSSLIFSALDKEKLHVEYQYTDISRSFINHAKEAFSNYSFIDYSILDIENPIKNDNQFRGKFDIVIAANVLHATANITQTMNNVKSLLKNKGCLLLNEMSDKNYFTSLTFGLLDGWWLSQDKEWRIPRSPILNCASWWELLHGLGYYDISFPADKLHCTGHTIISARSNGLNYKLPLKVNNQALLNKEGIRSINLFKKTIVNGDDSNSIKAELLNKLSSALQLDISKIDTSEPFSDYGVDSIVGVGFVKKLNEKFNLSLNTAILFDYTNIDDLDLYIKSLVLPLEDVSTEENSSKANPYAHLESKFFSDEISVDDLLEEIECEL